MSYLPDANAVISPFWDGYLNAIRLGLQHSLGLRHSSIEETRQWLLDWFTNGFKSCHLVGANELFDEVIDRKNDLPSNLLKNLKEAGCIKTLEPKQDTTFSYIQEITEFVKRNYEAYQAEKFLKGNDLFLIALAKTHRATLITLERYDIPQFNGTIGKLKGSPRMPFVAWIFGVRCITLYQAFTEIH